MVGWLGSFAARTWNRERHMCWTNLLPNMREYTMPSQFGVGDLLEEPLSLLREVTVGVTVAR